MTVQIDADRGVERLVGDLAVADLDHDGVDEDGRVHPLQWAAIVVYFGRGSRKWRSRCASRHATGPAATLSTRYCIRRPSTMRCEGGTMM